MPASMFDPAQEITPGLGPNGAGPVEPGTKILSLQVWFFQRGPTGAAFASGSRHDTGPFFDDRWVIATKLENGSQEFDLDVPVSAMALAIVEHPDGSRDIEQWNQAVKLEAASA